MWVTILLCSIGLICYRINEPLWESGHQGFHITEYPHNALNYLRFGYVRTKLGLVMNYGTSMPGANLTFRSDHPMLTALLISFAYRAFGVHDWSARLFPVLLAIGTSIMTFLLTWRITLNRWAAILAFFFCALSPMLTYYGRMPAPHNLATFFSVLVFYSYWRWFTERRTIFLVCMFAFLVIGAYTGWVTYFVVPPIVIHSLVWNVGRRKWQFAGILLASPFMLFVLYVAWTYWLGGNDLVQSLWHIFVLRSGTNYGVVKTLMAVETWRVLYSQVQHWLTSPILLLVLGGCGGCMWLLFKRRVSASQGLVLSMLFFGISYDLIFSNLAVNHDFVTLYHLVPVLSLAAAVALTWVVIQCYARTPLLAVVTLGVSLSWFGGQSLQTYLAQHNSPPEYVQAYYIGRALNASVAESSGYVDMVGFYEHMGTLRVPTIADRPYRQANTLSELLDAINEAHYDAVVLKNSNADKVSLRQYLVERYPRQDVMGYSIFRLDQPGSNTLVEHPAIQHPYHITFGEQIEFLGYDVSEIVRRKDSYIGWFDRYLIRYAELLPQYRTTFQVVNYWRRLDQVSANYALRTQFESQSVRLYRLEQSEEGLDDLYPTSLWPLGPSIREELEIAVPLDYPSSRYDMWISVAGVTEPLRPGGKDMTVDNQSRVHLGQIEVRSSKP